MAIVGERVDGLYEERQTALRILKFRGMGLENSWKAIYRFLIPDTQLIPSPCKVFMFQLSCSVSDSNALFTGYEPICDNHCQMDDDEDFRKLVSKGLPGEIAKFITAKFRPIHDEILSQRPEIARMLTENIRDQYLRSKSSYKGSLSDDGSIRKEYHTVGSSEETVPRVQEEIATTAPEEAPFIPLSDDFEFNHMTLDTLFMQNPEMNHELVNDNSNTIYEDGWSAGHKAGYEEGYLDGQRDGTKTAFARARKAEELGREKGPQQHARRGGPSYPYRASGTGNSIRIANNFGFDMHSTIQPRANINRSYVSSNSSNSLTGPSMNSNSSEQTDPRFISGDESMGNTNEPMTNDFEFMDDAHWPN